MVFIPPNLVTDIYKCSWDMSSLTYCLVASMILISSDKWFQKTEMPQILKVFDEIQYGICTNQVYITNCHSLGFLIVSPCTRIFFFFFNQTHYKHIRQNTFLLITAPLNAQITRSNKFVLPQKGVKTKFGIDTSKLCWNVISVSNCNGQTLLALP